MELILCKKDFSNGWKNPTEKHFQAGFSIRWNFFNLFYGT
jgi:hypothetical protein